MTFKVNQGQWQWC